MSEYPKKPDYPYHQRAVEALRRDGAIIQEARNSWLCELSSTLKALRLQERGEVKRRMEGERLPRYICVIIGDGVGEFVPIEQYQSLVDKKGPQKVAMDNKNPRQVRAARFIPWDDLAPKLVVLSDHPAAVEWTTWLCGEFLPAIHRHRYYDPATNHEPPPSGQLDALEIRESGRDVLNKITPGLGDVLAGETGGDPIA
jgi:hypothetical protein